MIPETPFILIGGMIIGAILCVFFHYILDISAKRRVYIKRNSKLNEPPPCYGIFGVLIEKKYLRIWHVGLLMFLMACIMWYFYSVGTR